ncbi:MAG: shikimate kinase [Ignavibacteria bacterium]|nr:shikimate kinase [Ignavibacteria bacterium]
MKLIYLTGFMTCGKSTLGPILANTLGWNFVDLDELIKENEKMDISEIFAQKGEDYFRNIETEILKSVSGKNGYIIALGGGTIVKEENFEIMRKTGKIIYLRASAEVIYNRIKTKLDRPIFKDLVLAGSPKNDFIERIESLLNERKKYYEQADLIVNTSSDPLGTIVDQLSKKIARLIYEKN